MSVCVVSLCGVCVFVAFHFAVGDSILTLDHRMSLGPGKQSILVFNICVGHSGILTGILMHVLLYDCFYPLIVQWNILRASCQH